MKTTTLIIACVLGALSLSAQETERLLLAQFHLTNGEVYSAYSVEETDSSYKIKEFQLGELEIKRKRVQMVERYFAGDMVRIELVDGSIYQGRLVSADLSNLNLETTVAGEVSIDRKSLAAIATIVDKQSISNPNRTRYFFGPSALPLHKGEGYYQNAYILANSANFGLSEHFGLGAGIVLPIFFYLTPKYSVRLSENVHAAVGAIGGTSILPGSFLAGGLPFAVVTVGSSENNVTIGSGYGLIYGDGSVEHTNYPIGVVNGMFRLSPRLSFVSENWIIPIDVKYENEVEIGTDPFGNPLFLYGITKEPSVALALSGGLRILAGAKATFDIAPVYLYFNDQGFVVPYLDFTYRF